MALQVRKRDELGEPIRAVIDEPADRNSPSQLVA